MSFHPRPTPPRIAQSTSLRTRKHRSPRGDPPMHGQERHVTRTHAARNHPTSVTSHTESRRFAGGGRRPVPAPSFRPHPAMTGTSRMASFHTRWPGGHAQCHFTHAPPCPDRPAGVTPHAEALQSPRRSVHQGPQRHAARARVRPESPGQRHSAHVTTAYPPWLSVRPIRGPSFRPRPGLASSSRKRYFTHRGSAAVQTTSLYPRSGPRPGSSQRGRPQASAHARTADAADRRRRTHRGQRASSLHARPGFPRTRRWAAFYARWFRGTPANAASPMFRPRRGAADERQSARGGSPDPAAMRPRQRQEPLRPCSGPAAGRATDATPCCLADCRPPGSPPPTPRAGAPAHPGPWSRWRPREPVAMPAWSRCRQGWYPAPTTGGTLPALGAELVPARRPGPVPLEDDGVIGRPVPEPLPSRRPAVDNPVDNLLIVCGGSVTSPTPARHFTHAATSQHTQGNLVRS